MSDELRAFSYHLSLATHHCFLNSALKLCCNIFVVADEVFDDAAFAIKDNCLRNPVVVACVEIRHLRVWEAERVFQVQSFGKIWNQRAVIRAADVETDDD